MKRHSEIESYVVRIYRRGTHTTADFVGLVQDPEQPQPQPFRSREELLAILDGRPTSPDDEK